ncbi:hypothetical protein [Demequina sp. NBRC 110052]|uniref:hypothetical protein n=1 Tax=Demequina sp. NBRC 110052 TaxID=1570341 RepID=UPI0009FDB5F0|nr:hypothetical protein [Demequina sp. NBRC 110052]
MSQSHTASAGVSRLRQRALIAASVAGIAALAVGGAAAADEAKPGDALYEIDRALEAAEEALEDMDELEGDEAEELSGLLNAAQSVLSNGSEQSLERRTQVAEMLVFMATTDLKGKEFGQAVSQHARGIWVDPETVDEETTEDETVAEGDEVTGEDEIVDEELTLDDEKAAAKAEKAAEKAEAKAAKAAEKAAKKAEKSAGKVNKGKKN